MAVSDRGEPSEFNTVEVPSSVNFEAAQSAVKRLTREYPAVARGNLSAERDRFAENVSIDLQGEFQELRKFAHNFTGQGASFNYPLITEIADSLRLYLRACDTHLALEPHIVEAHFEAMQDVLDRELSGDGGDSGREIMARLRTVIERPHD